MQPLIEGVLEHNRHDLVSLAAIMSHALWLAYEGPEACREPAEQLALGRIYERAGDLSRAREAFEMAARSTDADVQRRALARSRSGSAGRALRGGRRCLAARAGHGARDRRRLSPLERRAAEALAIHHEHRAKDLGAARRYADALERQASGPLRREVEKRIRRLERKSGSRAAHWESEI